MEGAKPTTTFMIMSETHNYDITAADPTCPLAQPLPKVDVLLHCGDLTQVGGLSAYKKALRLLATVDAELKLVIAGNHEISLDGEYWQTHLDEDDELEEHDKAVAIMNSDPSVTYLTEGTHAFTLKNGSTFRIYASPYRPECGDWAFGYPRGEDHFCHLPQNVDIVMTHGPPQGILDQIPSKAEHAGCESLLRAVEHAKPLMHCFGHIHEGYGAESHDWTEAAQESPGSVPSSHETATTMAQDARLSTRKGSTLFVNAAIMVDHNEPRNAP